MFYHRVLSAIYLRAIYLRAICLCTIATGGCSPVTSLTPNDAKPLPKSVELADDQIAPLSLNDHQVLVTGIEVATARVRPLQVVQQVPGKLQYDQRFRVTVRSPVAGSVDEIFVLPGTAVRTGDPLLQLSSPEIGAFRAKLFHAHAELERVSKLQLRDQEVFDGIKQLSENVKSDQSTETILDTAKQLQLGAYREHLIASIVEARLAKQILANYSEATAAAVPPRALQEQSAKVQSTLAALQESLEQSQFEAEQAMLQSKAALHEAEMILASQQGAWENILSNSSKMNATQQSIGSTPTNTDTNSLIVRAPREGVVVNSQISVGERIEPLSTLVTIANTQQLWAIADVRQQEWDLLQIPPGSHVEFSVPAIGSDRYQGKVLYTASDVVTDSQTLPLVVEVKTDDRRLKAGLYIRLSIPQGKPVEALAVPKSAIIDHEGKAYVFVEKEPNHFVPTVVEQGMQSNELIEIKGGLVADERFVVKNAFALKSIWLLEREEE